MHLGQWAEQFNVVETNGAHTARVRLLTGDDEIWHTWDASELKDTQKWQESVAEHLSGLADNLGKGKHTVMLIAEDHSGNIRSKFPSFVTGRDTKQPSKGSEITALVAGMDALSRTMRSMLEMQDELLRAQQAHVLAVTEQNQKLSAELAEERETKGGDEITQAVLGNLANQLGPVLEVLPDLMRAYSSAKKLTVVKAG
jgi:hypothetical protein